MSNFNPKTVRLQVVMRSADFRKGFEDAKKGKPMLYQNDTNFDYERGRHFAYCYDGPLKNGRKLALSAVYAFSEAVNNRSVV